MFDVFCLQIKTAILKIYDPVESYDFIVFD